MLIIDCFNLFEVNYNMNSVRCDLILILTAAKGVISKENYKN